MEDDSTQRIQIFEKKVGNVFNTRKVEIKNDCDTCPHRVKSTEGVPQSLRDEAEFKKLAGFITGETERRLLDEFHRKHNIPWRGNFSIQRMWQHRTLEYDSDKKELRLKWSRLSIGYGWFVTAMSVVILAASVLGISKASSPYEWTIVASYFVLSLFSFWIGLNHMVAPETTARRIEHSIKKKSGPFHKRNEF